MTNDKIYTQKRSICSAYIDSGLKLGIAQAVLMVQDNLTECFNKMNCDGIYFRELGYFWVFTKSKLKFFRRPVWREVIETSTFTVQNSGMRTNVNSIFKDKTGETLLVANQEACVLDIVKHRPVPLSKVPYPQDGFPEKVFTGDFVKFGIPDQDFEEVYEQVIRSSNIDMSHHLNNIEYIKFALNVFTEEYLLSHEPDELEVHYTGESKEGQTLKILKADKEDGTYIKIKESDRSVFEMKISFLP
ncbi:MAG: hypothetical protein IKM96_01725 [Clostridiales bacterium]|nr:hypothetical protein [Clostridiales bacterium]